MRSAILLIFAIATPAVRGADLPARAAGVLDGQKVKFPAKEITNGVKATLGLLESCHDKSLYDAEEFKKARKGEHIRVIFPKAVPVTVMDEKLKISELVFRLPIHTGVFWVRSQSKWRRYSKFEFPKQQAFEKWLDTAEPIVNQSL